VQVGNLKIVRLEPLPNKNTKDEANKQKPNSITSAETADSEKLPVVYIPLTFYLRQAPLIRVPESE
jgi:hypothetical protein